MEVVVSATSVAPSSGAVQVPGAPERRRRGRLSRLGPGGAVSAGRETCRKQRFPPDAVSYIVLVVTLQGIDSLVQAVRQRIETEGLRPFALRTGIPLGQLRSVVQGRASRYTTLESIASALGMRLFIGPAEGGGEAPQLPEEITRALRLPPDAGIVDAVGVIDKDAMASQLREGMRAVEELTRRAAVAAELLPRLAGDPAATRMMPFAEHVRLKADTGEVEFEESAHVSIAVSEKVLPPWARADHLTCVRAVGDSMAPTIHDGALVVVAKDRRAAVDNQLFVVLTDEGLVVRRLQRAGDHWNLVVDNTAHLSKLMTSTDVIVGRVAWHGPHGDTAA